MSYKALINSQLKKAFILLKDLAEDATIVPKSNGDFNFSTEAVKKTSITKVVTKAIAVKSIKASNKTKTIEQSILLRTDDVGDLKMFDSVMFKGHTWSIGPAVNDDGYVMLLTLYREA